MGHCRVLGMGEWAMSIEIGKPYNWNSLAYGTVAVHVMGFSPNGAVALLAIDGGEDSTPAQTFPELSDGTGFAVLDVLAPRTRRTSRPVSDKPATVRKTATNPHKPRKAPAGKAETF